MSPTHGNSDRYSGGQCFVSLRCRFTLRGQARTGAESKVRHSGQKGSEQGKQRQQAKGGAYSYQCNSEGFTGVEADFCSSSPWACRLENSTLQRLLVPHFLNAQDLPRKHCLAARNSVIFWIDKLLPLLTVEAHPTIMILGTIPVHFSYTALRPNQEDEHGGQD